MLPLPHIAGITLVLTLTAGLIGYNHGAKHATLIANKAMDQHLIADGEAYIKALVSTRTLEAQLLAAQTEASTNYERGKADAEKKRARVVDDLRSGNLRLQHHWAGCETQRLSDATAAAAKSDGGTGDREESAGRIVSAAASCDAQVRGLQELLRAQTSTDSSRR